MNLTNGVVEDGPSSAVLNQPQLPNFQFLQGGSESRVPVASSSEDGNAINMPPYCNGNGQSNNEHWTEGSEFSAHSHHIGGENHFIHNTGTGSLVPPLPISPFPIHFQHYFYPTYQVVSNHPPPPPPDTFPVQETSVLEGKQPDTLNFNHAISYVNKIKVSQHL